MRFAVACLLLVGLQSGCSTTTPASTTNSDVIIPKTTKVLDEASRKALSAYSADTGELVFASSTPIIASIAVGDVVVSTHNPPLAPDGLLRAVTSVTKNGAQVTLATEPAGLTRAIQQGSFAVSAPITGAMITDTKTMDGVTLVPMSLGLSTSSIPDGRGIRINLDNVAVGLPPDPLVLNGHITIDALATFQLAIRNFAVNNFEFRVTLANDTDVQIHGHLESGDHISHEFGPLFTITLGVIDVQIGPYPLVIVFALEMKIGVKASGSISTMSLHSIGSSSSTAGMHYDAAVGWTDLSSGNATGSLEYTPDTSYNLVADLYPHMETQMRFYDVFGPYVYQNTGVQLDIANLRHPFLRAGIHVEIGAGIKVSIIDDISMGATAFAQTLANFLDYSHSVYDHVFNFYNSPNLLPTVAITSPPESSSFGPDDTLTLSATAADVEDGVPAGGNLHVIWSSDVDGMLGEGATLGPIDQRTLFAHGAGMRTITATARDTDGGMTTAHVTVNLTAPPLGVSLLLPSAAVDHYKDVPFRAMGIFNDPFNLDTDLCALPGYTFTWSSSDMGDVFSTVHGCPNTRVTTNSYTPRTITLTVAAPYSRSGSASVMVTPIDQPPNTFPQFAVTSPAGSVLNHGGDNPDVPMAVLLGPPIPPSGAVVTYVWTATSYHPDNTLFHDRVDVTPKPNTLDGFLWQPGGIPGFIVPGGDTLIRLDVTAAQDKPVLTGTTTTYFHYFDTP